ncbi:glycosyltransferase family 2 protein [Helicobacter typhlonius]|uniref:glycosyltransferase family 2 protein n=1 Tax=Helicobacter typhlonius TaxID=76936 RepID=UPI002FE0AE92
MAKLSLIVPCYNEADSLLSFCKNIFAVFEDISKTYSQSVFELIFVNDGSSDNTLQILRSLQNAQEGSCDIQDSAFLSIPPPAQCKIKIIDFSRNFGKESAIYAGLQASKGDCVALIDADLQDPPTMLLEMYKKWQDKEADIIYARRISRAGESFIRAKLSEGFYILSNLISQVHLESGVRDFRLMDRQVVNALLSMSEYHRFSKAMFEWVGFKKIGLEYEYIPRTQGNSGWSFWKLFKYAIEGFISFSTMPLRVAFVLGFVMSALSLGYGCYAVISTLIFHNAVAGWTSLVVWIAFLGGVQLIILGIIGEYIARIYEQVKSRPHYIARDMSEDTRNDELKDNLQDFHKGKECSKKF